MTEIFLPGLLNEKAAFITGGGSGIGLTIASLLARHGARVVICGRKQERLDQAVSSIRACGGQAEGYAADVRNYDAVAGALAQARQRFGEIDVLVCGAAGNFPAPATGISANGFKSVVDIDLLGTFNTCRAGYEHLRKPGASVVAISAWASRPVAMQAHVCAAKAGVDSLTKTLALEWGPEGIRVNAVSPGPVDDTEGTRRLTPTPELRRAVMDTIPLRRYATRDEIAALVLFLCSSAAGYITGAVVVSDGGQSLAGPTFS